jgi:hypothetical protein
MVKGQGSFNLVTDHGAQRACPKAWCIGPGRALTQIAFTHSFIQSSISQRFITYICCILSNSIISFRRLIVFAAYLKALSEHLPVWTEENHERPI